MEFNNVIAVPDFDEDYHTAFAQKSINLTYTSQTKEQNEAIIIHHQEIEELQKSANTSSDFENLDHIS
jgi:hypothetical protein